MYLRIGWLCSILFWGYCNAALSANVYVGSGIYSGDPVVYIEGKIEDGDLLRVKSKVKNVILNQDDSYLDVYLNSGGGDISEAIAIGRFLRFILARTLTKSYTYYDPSSKEGKKHIEWMSNHPEDTKKGTYAYINYGDKIPDKYIGKCYSACVLIFFGGAKKDSSDNSFFRDSKNRIPTIGFHRPFFDAGYYSKLSPVDAAKEYTNLKRKIADYLDEMGAPEDILERMLKTSSDKIELIPHSKFETMYRRKEPFLEEWLNSRCGYNQTIEQLVGAEDAEYFNRITDEKAKKATEVSVSLDDYSYYNDIFESHFPPGSDIERYRSLETIIKGQRVKTYRCKEASVYLHQVEWALAYDEK